VSGFESDYQDEALRDARIRQVMREIEESVKSFLVRTPEEAEAEWAAFGEAEAERLNAMDFDEQLRVFALHHGVEEIDVEKWKETVSGLHWSFKPADGENLATLNVTAMLKRPIEQVYVTVRIGVRDAEVVFTRERGWHLTCSAEKCVWWWGLRGQYDQEEIERGQEMHRVHHKNDHPLDMEGL
jgi:hypothetical protein